jgi:hypothetical protein
MDAQTVTNQALNALTQMAMLELNLALDGVK